MPIAAPSVDSMGAYNQPQSPAGASLIVAPVFPTARPSSLADAATWDSGTVFSDGYSDISIGILADHAGTLKITRYIDMDATLSQAVSSTAIVANTMLVVNLTDGLPFCTFKIEVVNASGAAMAISKFAVLQTAT